MTGAAGEQIQGLSADEKERRRLVGIDLTEQTEIIRRFNLSIEDRRRMHTLDASDPEIGAYSGFPEIQAEAIKDEQAARETAQRRADGSLKAHLPAAAILGTEQPAPPAVMPPEGHMYD